MNTYIQDKTIENVHVGELTSSSQYGGSTTYLYIFCAAMKVQFSKYLIIEKWVDGRSH